MGEKDRSRRSSAHERQKESESLFDKLLTVSVDLPARSLSKKSPGSSKSPSGVSLKSPGGSLLKSPAGALRSPGLSKSPNCSKSPIESQKSPISHRSPMISPGAKPTYLLAHAFDKSGREAEKIHRAQELSMKDQDRCQKEKEKQCKEAKPFVKENTNSLLAKEVSKEKFNSEKSTEEVNIAPNDMLKDRKDFVKDRKDMLKDRKEMVKDKKEIVKDCVNKEMAKDKKDMGKDRKDIMKDRKDIMKDRKDILKDRKDMAKDRKDTIKEKPEALKDKQDNDADISTMRTKALQNTSETRAVTP